MLALNNQGQDVDVDVAGLPIGHMKSGVFLEHEQLDAAEDSSKG